MKSEFYGQSAGFLGRGITRRKAATYTGQHKQNKRRQTGMLRVGFEPTIPLFERAKTLHAVYHASLWSYPFYLKSMKCYAYIHKHITLHYISKVDQKWP
jgi:hypothetical protein